MARIRTKIDTKYIKSQATINEDITHKGTGESYLYKVSCDCIEYLLKQFKFNLGKSEDKFKTSLNKINEVYQEFFFLRSACAVNPHLIKPLFMDYAIDLADKEDSHLFIEILFENPGICLMELYQQPPVKLEVTHNLMKQSANALLLLHNMDIVNLSIKPNSMAYDKEKDVLKIVDVGSAFKKNAIENEEKCISVKLEYVQRMNIYNWALSFCILIFKEEYKESDNTFYKLKINNKDYIEEKFDSLGDFVNTPIKEIIKRVMLRALSKEELSIKEIVRELEEFDINNKKMKDSPKFNRESCTKCSGKIPRSVKLSCGHVICKDCLIEYVLNKFFYDRLYQYCFDCSKCKKLCHLTSLQLDCDCVEVQLREESKAIKKCEKDHPLTYIDHNLINDYTNFKNTSLMLNEYPNKTSALRKEYAYALLAENIETIVWALTNTEIVTEFAINEKRWEVANTRELCKALIKSDFGRRIVQIEELRVMCEGVRTNKVLDILIFENSFLELYSCKVIAEVLKVNTTLKKLSLRSTILESEGRKIISEGLKINKALVELNLGHCKLEDEGVKAIAEALKTNKTIVRLYLNENIIKAGGAKAIAQALMINRSLEELNLNQNEIGKEGAKAISEALKINRTLKELNLKINQIGDEGAKGFSEVLEFNKALIKLDLTFNFIRDKGVKAIIEILKTSKTFIGLNLSSNRIAYESAVLISEMIKTNKILTNLNIGSVIKRAEASRVICESLGVNKTLKEIVLEDIGVGVEDAKLIGDMLKINQSIIELNLNTNKIRDEGAKAIAEALKLNGSLEILRLSTNGIMDEGARAISDMLEVNKSITVLELFANSIGDKGTKDISRALETNTTLEKLILRSNIIKDEGAKGISDALRTNTALKELILRGNLIEDEGAEAIGLALKSNKTLEVLDIWMRGIKDKGTRVIYEGLKTNTGLTELYLYNTSLSPEVLTMINNLKSKKLKVIHS